MKNLPNKIYLQSDKEGDKPIGDYYNSEEITWCQDRINNTDTEYIKASLLEWHKVEDKLPEDYPNLIKDEAIDYLPTQTVRVLARTETGSITDNCRVKMAVGKKEWKWLMGYADEEVTHWRLLVSPVEDY